MYFWTFLDIFAYNTQNQVRDSISHPKKCYLLPFYSVLFQIIQNDCIDAFISQQRTKYCHYRSLKISISANKLLRRTFLLSLQLSYQPSLSTTLCVSSLGNYISVYTAGCKKIKVCELLHLFWQFFTFVLNLTSRGPTRSTLGHHSQQYLVLKLLLKLFLVYEVHRYIQQMGCNSMLNTTTSFVLQAVRKGSGNPPPLSSMHVGTSKPGTRQFS